MEWVTSLKTAVSYIEENILSNISTNDVADKIYMSSYYFQKGFSILTGYTVSEYIRNRRLYLASLELSLGRRDSIIDISMKYLYESPESFSKAYKNFHGFSPKHTLKNISNIHIFLPLNISIDIKGGNVMDYRVEKLPEFKVIGIRKAIKYENAYDQIPNIWKEFMGEYCTNNVKKVISDNNVGEFALCLSSQEENTFDYVICGKYQGGEVPQGFEVITVSEHQWAIFKATGIMPTAFQTVNSFVYKEWLPGNDKYEIAEDIDVEHYQKENLNSNECNAELWIPIKIKI